MDSTNHLPLYMQVAEKIKNMIACGAIKPGARLSIRAVHVEFGISKNTAEKAINILKDEGIAESVPKSSTTIKKEAWAIITGGSTPNWNTMGSKGFYKNTREFASTIIHRILNPENFVYKYGQTFYEGDFHIKERLEKAIEYSDVKSILYNAYNNDIRFSETKKNIVIHMQQYGIKTEEDSILLFGNLLHAYNALVYSIFRHGSNLFRMHPDIVGSMENFTSVGANRHWLARDNDGIVPEDLLRKISNGKHNILSINPVNQYPTGITMTATRRNEILEICQKYKVPIIENDTMRDLWLTQPPPPMKSDDKYDQIIYVGTLSINASPIAWMIVPKGLMPRIADVGLHLYGYPSVFEIELLATFLKSGHYYDIMTNIRNSNACRLPKIEAALTKYMKGLASWHPHCINYHIHLDFDQKINTEKLFYDCHNISFFPGEWYRDPATILLNSVCESVGNTEQALSIIKENAEKQLH